jgi:hypothetical protein
MFILPPETVQRISERSEDIRLQRRADGSSSYAPVFGARARLPKIPIESGFW